MRVLYPILFPMELLSAVFGIVLIDLVLSGDNAVVIGMAAHRLPPRQRRLAILFGGGAAIVLRLALTAIAALLLTLPYLKAIGGLLLLGVAYKLLREEESADAETEPNSRRSSTTATLRGAIVTILLADFIMSLDNVLGVAAASHGDVALLLFGLGLSMAILMLGGSIVASVINRLWWLAYVGTAVIAWTGIEMFLEDPAIEHLSPVLESAAVHLGVGALVTAFVVGLAHLFQRHLPARRHMVN